MADSRCAALTISFLVPDIEDAMIDQLRAQRSATARLLTR